MKRASLFAFLILFSACSEAPLSRKEQTADAVLKQAASALKKERGLIAIGTGGQMRGPIQMLALSFEYRNPVGVEEGRQLLLSARKELLDQINADSSIRAFLGEYPFTEKNVEIRIFVRNPDGSSRPEREIALLSAIDHRLEYGLRNRGVPRFEMVSF